jgi:TRAP-type C4-dicarboxylate transport system substrate-binding protein
VKNADARYRKLRVAPLIAAFAFLAACGSDAQQQGQGSEGDGLLEQDVEMSMVTFAPIEDSSMIGYEIFLEEVEQAFDGKLAINYLGGEEAIAAFEQPDAVRSGVVDIVFTGATYPEGIVPVAAAMDGSLLTPAEERAEGVFDEWQNIYRNDMNAVYLGRFLVNRLHHLWTDFEVSGIDDFKGKTFRASPAQQPLVEGLGASAVVMSPGDVYTALERGVVDGFGWPSVGMLDLGLGPLTSQRIDPGFYAGAGVMLVNAAKFDAMPEAAQEELIAIGERVEERVAEEFTKLSEQETEQMKAEHGIEVFTLEGEEAEEYQQLAYDALWEKILDQAPEQGQKLYEATYEGRELAPPLQ